MTKKEENEYIKLFTKAIKDAEGLKTLKEIQVIGVTYDEESGEFYVEFDYHH